MATRRLVVCGYDTYNEGNNTHLFFSSVSTLVSALGLNVLASVPLDNYRVNNGSIVLQADTNYKETQYNLATYAFEYEVGENANVNFLRCYFVDSVKFQSENVIMVVRLDLWGTYIKDVTFKRMHLTRSNLYGNDLGFYDDALAIGFLNALEDSRLQGTFTPSQVSILFLLSYNVSQGVFNNEKIARTETYALTLQECIDACNLTGLNKASLTAVEMALDIVGGVYGVQSNTGSNEAEVIKAWIVPTSWLSYGDVVMQGMNVKSLFTQPSGNVVSNVRQVVPSFKTGSYNLANFSRFVSDYPNVVVVFGPKYNGFRVPRRLPAYSTKELRVYYRVTIGQDDVQVILYTGEDEHDVSQNFEARLTTANNVANPLQAMARDLSFGLRYAKGLVGAYGTSGGYGAALAGVSGIVDNIKSTGTMRANGSGDGFATWNEGAARNATHEIKRPYFYMYYETMADEKARAVIQGAKYDVFLDNLTALKTTAQNMRFVATSSKETRAFVQIDEALITGAPVEAIEYIKEELARGIYYEFRD